MERVDAAIAESVAPAATEVDRTGEFPSASIAALAAAGALGATVPAEFGGSGAGVDTASEVIRRISGACGSTAMIVAMHYSATAMLVAAGRADALAEIAAGTHLTTLAFSESGSRSHFWAPLSTARASGDAVVLDARKSWVTAAHHADSYVWSSRPLAAEGPMTLWYVPRTTPGIAVAGGFDGLGLRGNDSCPVVGADVVIPRANMLGDDGAGLDAALSVVLPWFLVLNASASLGLMQAVTAATTAHLVGTRLEHVDQSLAQQLPARTRLARMQIEADRNRALITDAAGAVVAGRPDASLLVLEAKASADQGSAAAADLAMTACGGAAFRRELAVERRFRDSRAAQVMAPTTDALWDIVGRALCGLPLIDPAEFGRAEPGQAEA
ncbi:acyl-CoA dehydrogenase family protein [Tsukamurella soli]|uniref:acyl-CoA dehydrogenase family protein n=1 Tax=Tsukamurella soli TaxID=644556 RepID=UPI00360E70F2